MSDNKAVEPYLIEEAAYIIADLISCMDKWERDNLSAVAHGLSWLKRTDHPKRWLRASVRDMMAANR